ncbi:DUF397 domain-containing protein [Streptomyces sp. SID8379]|uniref:DUF397 domain-containing protein n=1 Tax=unclassified Streptomyces TaxID=2593676 RepID=UPI000996849D|nr:MULTISPECIES: DUF397 domain-containing protein [unclassified Streptomyces]MYW66048.1 DUF397 domain-containing protein [Streptomyces sp. SID8379]
MTTDHPESSALSEAPEQLRWLKSSYSNGAGGECVECAIGAGGEVLVRDSKRADGPTLTVEDRTWACFLSGLGVG